MAERRRDSLRRSLARSFRLPTRKLDAGWREWRAETVKIAWDAESNLCRRGFGPFRMVYHELGRGTQILFAAIAAVSSVLVHAAEAVKWAFGQKEKILVVPDRHLGRNVATILDSPEEMVVWSPGKAVGGTIPTRSVRRQGDPRDGICLRAYPVYR